ncbi:unnamed protein product, partial [Mesorhabditis spiculigera]
MGRVHKFLELQLWVVYFFAVQAIFALQKIYRTLLRIDRIPEGHVRLCSIVHRKKRDVEEIARGMDFLSVHNSFVPTSLLDGSHWTLYCLTKNTAYFVYLPKPVLWYNSQRCPFVYVDYFKEALLVAEAPREEFEKLADELADRPQADTIFYTNTARCGSTLLAKMLHNEGKSHCVAEPYPIPCLTIGYAEGYLTKEDVTSLLPRVITILRKDVPADQVFILKAESSGVRLVEFTDNIPQFRNIFSFRKDGIDSCERMLKREEIGDVLTTLHLYLPRLTLWIFGYLAGHYLKNESRFLMPCIWFHDLIHNTEQLLREIFRNIGIPEETALEAMKWKGEDSQKGTFLSKEALQHIEIPPMTAEELTEMRQYAEAMEIPVDTLIKAEKP